MKKNWYVFILLICVSCNVIKKSAFDPGRKFSSTELKEDFSVLNKVLKSNHPSLYWYTSQDSINNLFASAYNGLNDSLNEQQFRKRIAWVISKIHCGHTVVRPSKNYSKYYREQKVQSFPFLLKVWKDSAVVTANLLKEDTVIKRGTIITRINGIPVAQLVDSMIQLISGDGYSNVFKYQLISFNFPVFYKNSFGLYSSYKIQFVDSGGKLDEKTCRSFESNPDSTNSRQQVFPLFSTRKELRRLRLLNDRKMEIDSSLNAAILTVNTFSKGKLIRFFNHSFKEINERKIKNLVIDLRLNSGGSVLACTRLSQYLVDKPFNVSDTVAAVSRSFHYKKYIKPWLVYWLSMQISGRRLQDGRIHFRYFEKHKFKPKEKNHFDGKIFVLTGGYTFSAATLVAHNLKTQSNVTIVGEETGGGAYGNSAMLLTAIVLPNTHLRITLPLFRMVLTTSLRKDGRGVLPDIEVAPSSHFIKMGIDAKMDKVKERIRKRKEGL